MGFSIILCEILLLCSLGLFLSFVKDTSTPPTHQTWIFISILKFIGIIIIAFISFILGHVF